MISVVGGLPPEGQRRVRLRRDRGASSVEYAIIGSLIAAVIALVVANLGNQVRLLFESVRWW